METLDRDKFTLEQSTRDPIAQQVKILKTISDSLIDAMLEANDIILKSATTNAEPDKILPASKILTEAIANSVKLSIKQ